MDPSPTQAGRRSVLRLFAVPDVSEDASVHGLNRLRKRTSLPAPAGASRLYVANTNESTTGSASSEKTHEHHDDTEGDQRDSEERRHFCTSSFKSRAIRCGPT